MVSNMLIIKALCPRRALADLPDKRHALEALRYGYSQLLAKESSIPPLRHGANFETHFR